MKNMLLWRKCRRRVHNPYLCGWISWPVEFPNILNEERKSDREREKESIHKWKVKIELIKCFRTGSMCARFALTLSLALSFTLLSLSCVQQCAWTKTHPLFVCQNGCYLRARRATHALPLPLCSCHAHNFYMLIMRLFAVLVESGRGKGQDGRWQGFIYLRVELLPAPSTHLASCHFVVAVAIFARSFRYNSVPMYVCMHVCMYWLCACFCECVLLSILYSTQLL